MRRAVSAAGIAFAWLLSSSPAAAKPTFETFETPAQALVGIALLHPRVIAFGEYHEVKGAPKVPSAIARFTKELLPGMASIGSDLIVETWVTKGECGKTEEKVVTGVEETTRRPETTEDEIVTLLKRGKAAGLTAHILELSCPEYRALTDTKGELDLVALLRTVTVHLRDRILERLRAGPRDRTVLVYGGALHNDVHPKKELRQFSFADAITRAARGRYVEVDLYVPEYIERDREITAEPWYRAFAASPGDKTTLVRRSPRSFILVFPRTRSASAAGSSPDAGH